MAFPASAYVTTALDLQVTWSVAGVADADLREVSRFTQDTTRQDIFYTAPLPLAAQQTVSAAIHPTPCIFVTNLPQPNLCLDTAALTVTIPTFGYYSVTASEWKGQPWGTDPGVMSLVHGDYYTHENYNQMTRIYFSGTWMPNPTNAAGIGKFKAINIFVFPLSDLHGYQGVADVPWLKGFPDYSVFEPSRRKSPLGCGLCSRQGLPVFRVNTAALNPVVWDTDYGYPTLGPDIHLTRTYNADGTVTGMFGKSWNLACESSIDSHPFGAVVRLGTGRELLYSLNTNNNTYTPPAGVTARLAWQPSLAGRPGYGAFQYYDVAARQTWQYELPWSGGSAAHPPLSNGVPLAAIVDLNSNRVALAYAGGRLSAIQDAAGRTTTFKYNSQNLCTNIAVPGGHTLSYGYDAGGRLVQTRDALGLVSDLGYDSADQLVAMNSEGHLWQFQYLAPGLVGATINPLGHSNTWQLLRANVTNREVWARDALGNRSLLASRDGMTWQQTDSLDYREYTAYANGFPVTTTNARGYVTRREYDARGNLVRVTAPDSAVTSYGYTTNDWLVAITNALGGVTRYEYDARGNLVRQTLPSGRQTVMTYDARGQMLTLTDPATNTSTYAYDAQGNLVRMVDPLGYTNRYGYDSAGIECTNVINARGFAIQSAFDANRRRTRTVHPDGAAVQYSYDCCAQSAVTDARGYTWSVERDALLNVTGRVDALGYRTSQDYDANQNLVRTIDALGGQQVYTYDALNRLVSSVNAAGRWGQLWYDARNLTQVFPRYGVTYTYTYDVADRVVSKTDPLFHAEWYHYDLLGRVTNQVNARGMRTVFSYDIDSRLTAITNAGTLLAQFAYGPAGDLATMATAQGTTTYTRDKRRKVTQIAYPGGRSVQCTYDANANLATLAYPDGTVVIYSYDRRDRVTNMTWAGQSVSFAYDAAGHLVAENRSNGGISQYAHDGNGRMTDLVHWLGTNVLISLSFQRDALGNTVNTVRHAGYIPYLPVLSAGATAGIYNSMDQLSAWGGATCGYDADGNATNAAGARPFAVAYDAQNRLVACLRNGTNLACQYDGFGRRIQSVAGATTRKFRHDLRGRLLFETDGGNVVTAQYVYRGKALVAMWARDKGWHFYHYDALGNTLALSDAQGKISALYRYLPYGMPANGYARVPNPFTFIGRHGVMDDGGGLFLMGARHYDAVTGRFLQRDPIGFQGGWNLYAYVGANPVDRSDPSGLGATTEGRHDPQFYWDYFVNVPQAVELEKTKLYAPYQAKIRRHIDKANRERAAQGQPPLSKEDVDAITHVMLDNPDWANDPDDDQPDNGPKKPSTPEPPPAVDDACDFAPPSSAPPDAGEGEDEEWPDVPS